MKIGIFGGTFNPIHYGHLRAAQEIQELFVFDKFLFIPSGRPAFRKPSLVDGRHRLEMVKMAVRDNAVFEPCDTEIRTRGISYSVETVSRLRDRYKDGEFFFVFGVDAFLDLPKWKDPMRFAELTNMIVISRPGCSFTDICPSPYFFGLRKGAVARFLGGKRKRMSLKLISGKKAFLCRTTQIDISASGIRSLMKTGRSIKYLLPESVESYIITHKFYR